MGWVGLAGTVGRLYFLFFQGEKSHVGCTILVHVRVMLFCFKFRGRDEIFVGRLYMYSICVRIVSTVPSLLFLSLGGLYLQSLVPDSLRSVRC